MNASAGQPPAERADLAAWIAVVAASFGCFMAMLDISVVNASLPTIQGEIGASGTEGTWVTTSYLVAESVAIPLTAWLTRLLGLRTLMVGAITLFTIASVVCGFAHNLTMMIIGRAAQGFAAGGACVLDACCGNAGQAQGLRQWHGGLTDVVFFQADTEPRGFDLLDVDAGVGDRLVERLQHQIFRTAVPALAEAGTAHADDGNLVANSCSHLLFLYVGLRTGVAFQK